MAQAAVTHPAPEEAALPGLREQIFANAKHLFPDIINEYRSEHDNGNDEPKASDVFDVITLTDQTVSFYQGGVFVGFGIKAVLTYGATEHTLAKAAMSGQAAMSRLLAVKALLSYTEYHLETQAMELLRPLEEDRFYAPGLGVVMQGAMDQVLPLMNL